MEAAELAVIIRMVDQASREINQVKGALKGMGDDTQSARQSAGRSGVGSV